MNRFYFGWEVHHFEMLYHITDAVESKMTSFEWLKQHADSTIFQLRRMIKKLKRLKKEWYLSNFSSLFETCYRLLLQLAIKPIKKIHRPKLAFYFFFFCHWISPAKKSSISIEAITSSWYDLMDVTASVPLTFNVISFVVKVEFSNLIWYT